MSVLRSQERARTGSRTQEMQARTSLLSSWNLTRNAGARPWFLHLCENCKKTGRTAAAESSPGGACTARNGGRCCQHETAWGSGALPRQAAESGHARSSDESHPRQRRTALHGLARALLISRTCLPARLMCSRAISVRQASQERAIWGRMHTLTPCDGLRRLIG